MNSTLVDILEDPDYEKRRKALLSMLPLPSESFSELLCVAVAEQLASSDRVLRVLASQVLISANQYYPRMRPSLVNALKDDSSVVRANVAELLEEASEAETLRFHLIRLLSDDSYMVRIKAAQSLWGHSCDHQAVMPVVVDGLKSQEPEHVIEATKLAAKFSSDNGAIVDALLPLLFSENDAVRGHSLFAISKLVKDKAQLKRLATDLEADSSPLVKYLVEKILKEEEF